MSELNKLPSRHQIGADVIIRAKVNAIRFEESKVSYEVAVGDGHVEGDGLPFRYAFHIDSAFVDEAPKVLTDADAAADLAGTPRPT